MGKVFTKCEDKNGNIPISGSEVCSYLAAYATKYIYEKRPVIAKVNKRVRDAVLVDLINYLGIKGACDYALHDDNLYLDGNRSAYADPQCLLSVMVTYLPYYVFEYGMVESVLRNTHMHSCRKPFDENDGALVVLDFINYMSANLGYDVRFTMKDLYNSYKDNKQKYMMDELKTFLQLTGAYGNEMENGQSAESMFNNIAREHNLKYVDENGNYHYTDLIRNRIGYSKMDWYDVLELERELYAMAYAHDKLHPGEKTYVDLVDKKIAEMKSR